MKGTLSTRTMKAAKSGNRWTYEVYEASVGNLFVARVALMNGAQASTTCSTWSDPCDTPEAAMKSAFRQYRESYNEMVEKTNEYHRNGGY